MFFSDSLKTIIVGARDSLLSRAQVKEVFEEIKQKYPNIIFEEVFIKTKGDKDLNTSLKGLEKTDFFTKELDDMLLDGKCRIAIHSAKDLPDPLPSGLCIAALTRGVDSSDALVLREGESLQSLKKGARIGTSSTRREAAIKALREDLLCVDIRGNIQQRLDLLIHQKTVDGLIIAKAALIRLNLLYLNYFNLQTETAFFQGQLAVISRVGDEEMKELFCQLDVR